MNLSKRSIFFCLTLCLCLCLVFLSACGTERNTAQTENTKAPDNSTDQNVEVPQTDEQPEEDQQPINEEEIQEAIQIMWEDSPHAAAFVVDTSNENNRCAKCHSPIDWQPTLDDLPESCFSCKFELEDPEPYIAEQEWQNIPCMVCHEVGRKDKVAPEYQWLEIAQLEEYASVSSTTELCQKCHLVEGFSDHGGIQHLGVHQDMTCTACHDAHSTQAACLDSGCHEGTMESDIPGHTDEHTNLTCAACHDASGMDLGFRENDGMFSTLATISTAEDESTFFFSSHNLQLESACDRCHFAGNPYGISENISP